MIGGNDYILKNPGIPSCAMLDVTLRIIRRYWPDFIAQDVETGVIYGKYLDIPFGQTGELFVYKDRNAFVSWENGVTPENKGSMIHLIADEDETTIVTDGDAEGVARSCILDMKGLVLW